MNRMQQRIHQFGSSSPRPPTWRGRLGIFAAAVIGVALVGALAVLSLVIAAVLIPVVAIALLVFRWRIGRMQRQARAESEARRPTVIETDYVVLDRDRGD
jgi:hypothetical protein